MVAEPSRSAGEINWITTGTAPNQLVHDLLPHVKPDSTSRPGTLDESMATFLASANKPEDIPQDSGIADDGIVQMLWRMRAILNNLGYSIKDVVDEHNTLASCLNNTFSSISDWANKTEERLVNLESTRGGGGASTPWAKSISEVKAIQSLEQLGIDKAEFHNWMDRLVHALVQKDSNYRMFMNEIKETMD